MILRVNFYIKIKFNLRNNMKKVLLIILAGMFALTSAYAQPSFTLGVGLNKGVFAAEGKEDNFDEGGSLATTTVEYGAFEDTYASIYLEMGNEVGSIGLSYQDDVSTPTNVNEVGGLPGDNSATSTVSASFDDVITVYGLINLPMNTYLKAGIVQGDIAVNETQKSAFDKALGDAISEVEQKYREVKNSHGIVGKEVNFATASAALSSLIIFIPVFAV